MKSFVLFLTLFTSLFLAIPCYSQGKLKEAKDELKEKKVESPASNTQTPNDEDTNRAERSGFINSILLPYYILKLTKLTLFGKYKNELHLKNALTHYPYFDGTSGNYIEPSANFTAKPKRTRIDLSDHFLRSEDIYGNHLKAKLRPSNYFYFQVDYFVLLEKTLTEEGFTSLNLYNFNFCYDRIRFNKFNLGWTLGANYVASDINKAGFTYGLNLEAFLPKNISLFASLRSSKINGHPLNELEIQGRFHIKRCFISPGYEMIQIASTKFHFIAIGAGVYF